MELSKQLIKKYGFRGFHNYNREILDLDKFSCVLRIHEIHYLFWSDLHGYFTLGVKHEIPKGQAGGGVKHWTLVMIPKHIETMGEAEKLIESVCDFRYMSVICQ